MIGTALIGFFNIPLVPMVYEYSVELVFPVGEGIYYYIYYYTYYNKLYKFI